MRRRVIFVDDLTEAQRRGNPLAAALVEAADFHFLARQMIADEIDLQPRIDRIARVGVAADQFAQRVERLLRDLLIARHVGDLLVITERNQIIGVRRVLIARMDRQEALRPVDRFLVIVAQIIAECRHQLRTPRPDRVGMLALHLVEQDRRLLIPPAIEPVLGGRIKRVDIARDERQVPLGTLAAASGHRAQNRQRGKSGPRPGDLQHANSLAAARGSAKWNGG